jgi:2-oxoglutarate ferredoxin oxidoreductase subunit alpha
MKGNNPVLTQGNEACVEGALAAGMRFFAGYPITPSTEIAERAALRLPMVGGKFIQMEDEISSMAAVIGASAAGLKAMTATSGPGFSLKQENIGYAAMAELPCVIVDVQRAGPSTGLPTSPSQGDVMQARWGTHGDHPVIALAPSSVEETYMLTVRAFNLAEAYRTPVILLMDEIVGHMREGIELPAPGTLEIVDRKRPAPAETGRLPYRIDPGGYIPEMMAFGEGQRYNITGLVHDEWGFPTSSAEVAHQLCTRLMQKIEANHHDIVVVQEEWLEDADVAVVCFGGTARSVREAIKNARQQGIRAGLFRPITLWPFPAKRLEELSAQVKRILVVEHNYGQIVLEVERIVKTRCPLSFIGRVDGTVIPPDEIFKQLRGVDADGQRVG